MKKWFDGFAARYVAANGQISQEQFTVELNQQKWWQDHSASFIADYQQELEHPTDYAQSIKGDVDNMRASAQQMGAQVDDSLLAEMAKNARRFGWNQQQIQTALAAHVSAVNGDFEGQAGSTQDELMLWAQKNGVRLTPDLINSYARGVADGSTNIDEIKSDIRRTYMAGAYPAWADKINAGFDVSELAAPYRETVAGLLEDNSVGLDDPLMKSIMQKTDANGQPRVVPLYEAEQMVRGDDRWQRTDNAYKQYAGVAHSILRTWGFE
jgi:hypothetical protein